MNTTWTRNSLIYFFIIASLGLLMRLGFFTGNFLLNFKHLLHTHSHIAFLGWIYPVLFISIVNNFLSSEQIVKGKYHLQFYITQFLIAGMLVSFLLQGYGLFSIIFSTIFQFMTYWFAFQLFRDWKKDTRYSVQFLKTALWALVVSSLGTWSLAVIGAKGLAGSDINNLAIYFYLHFQYNGWFTFAILGLLMDLIEKNQIRFSGKLTELSFKFLTISLFPAYLLSILGKTNNSFIIYTAGAAGIIQIIGAALFLAMILRPVKELKELFRGLIKLLISVSLISFMLKNILQLMSVLPSLTEIAFNNRYVVIAYIHMVFIGFISMFLFGYLSYLGWYNLNSKLAKTGVIMLISGFSVTELLLITPPFKITIPALSLYILLFSCLMGAGIVAFLAGQIIFKSKEKIPLENFLAKVPTLAG
jgi:hypothetical protein